MSIGELVSQYGFYILFALFILTDALLIALLCKKPNYGEILDALEDTDDVANTVKLLGENNLSAFDNLRKSLSDNQNQASKTQDERLRRITDDMDKLRGNLSDSQSDFRTEISVKLTQMEETTERRLDAMRVSLAESVKDMREENAKKLDEIRGTVDEKLQSTLEKRIAESFKAVSDRLSEVYKSLGEMQSLAGDVGGLKKVLSGVKTRGILGEIQLGAILEEILTRDQYETNVATIPNSRERVEYAVKLPGSDGNTVYLPIDAKFPGERYAQLLDAQESGDKTRIDEAYKALFTVLRSEARDIHEKYVSVPYTTQFGILFLPFEGLYAEVVSHGMTEKLQRDFQINVAGPSTLAALLNSLQMGFRTLAIQKRSNEVWELLGAVKTQFDKFEETLRKMQTHLSQTSGDLDNLLGTRTKAIQRKLTSVQMMDADKAQKLIDED